MSTAEKLAEEIFRLIERDGGLIKDDLIKLIEAHMPVPKFNGQTWTYTTNKPTVTGANPFPPPPDPLPEPTSTLDLRQHQGNDYLGVIPFDIITATTEIIAHNFGGDTRRSVPMIMRKLYGCMLNNYPLEEIKQWADWEVFFDDMWDANEPTGIMGIMLELHAFRPNGITVELRLPLYSDMRPSSPEPPIHHLPAEPGDD